MFPCDAPIAPVRSTLPPTRLTVDQVAQLPALIGLKELCQVWGFGISQAHRLARRGTFEFLEVDPVIGSHRYSTALLQQYLRRELERASGRLQRKRGLR